jgi:hypothetical protein
MLYPDMWLRSQPWRRCYFHLVTRTELKGPDQEATDEQDEEMGEMGGVIGRPTVGSVSFRDAEATRRPGSPLGQNAGSLVFQHIH